MRFSWVNPFVVSLNCQGCNFRHQRFCFKFQNGTDAQQIYRFLRKLPQNWTQSIFGISYKDISLTYLAELYSSQNPDTVVKADTIKDQLDKIVDLLPEKSIVKQHNETFAVRKEQLLEIFNKDYVTKHFESHFRLLWYSSLPCFDIKGLTASVKGEKSVLKRCTWKGQLVSCSAIFTMVPTDSGMCCAFNKRKAQDVFHSSKYSRIIKELERLEDQNAFEGSEVPVEVSESQVGRKRGLTVMLDAHTDLLAEFSVNNDVQGFTALVTPPGDFPFVENRGFEVRSGHLNAVSLSATKISADPAIRSISPRKRNCLFSDETSDLKLHKVYTQANCLLECALAGAQESTLVNKNVSSCTPWFFPFLDEGHRVCNPWEGVQILESMDHQAQTRNCKHCLPDCDRIIYHKTITAQTFRQCTEKNFGISDLCYLGRFKEIDPPIWGSQVADQLVALGKEARIENETFSSSRRFIHPVLFNKTIFSRIERGYDAYDVDIAVLNVFFESPTSLEYRTRQSKTIVDFISAVGGNGGLFIGFSLVTILELMWLAITICSVYASRKLS